MGYFAIFQNSPPMIIDIILLYLTYYPTSELRLTYQTPCTLGIASIILPASCGKIYWAESSRR